MDKDPSSRDHQTDGSPLTAHPDTDRLTVYAEGKQTEDTERVRLHLLDCPECSEVVEDFRLFHDGALEPEAAALSDADIDSELAEIDKKAQVGTSFPKQSSTSWPWIWVTAASLLLAALLIFQDPAQKTRVLEETLQPIGASRGQPVERPMRVVILEIPGSYRLHLSEAVVDSGPLLLELHRNKGGLVAELNVETQDDLVYGLIETDKFEAGTYQLRLSQDGFLVATYLIEIGSP